MYVGPFIKTTSMYRVNLFFSWFCRQTWKPKSLSLYPMKSLISQETGGRERVIRHCEGEIEDHHHVRPSPTFNLASCHRYILPKPLMIHVSLNNKNWYQIWFRFCYFGLIFINLGIWMSIELKLSRASRIYHPSVTHLSLSFSIYTNTYYFCLSLSLYSLKRWVLEF